MEQSLGKQCVRACLGVVMTTQAARPRAASEHARSNQLCRVNEAPDAAIAMVRQADVGPKHLALAATSRRRSSVPSRRNRLDDAPHVTPIARSHPIRVGSFIVI